MGDLAAKILKEHVVSVTIQPVPNVTAGPLRRKVLQIHPQDNVLVALTNLKKGEEVSAGGRAFSLVSDVPAKHKFATASLQTGDPVLMYGVSIGRAVEPIGLGQLITTRNVHHYAATVEGKSASHEWT